jgi:hypothetical protein
MKRPLLFLVVSLFAVGLPATAGQSQTSHQLRVRPVAATSTPPPELRAAREEAPAEWLSALADAARTTCTSGDGDICSCNGDGCFATATACKCL